MSNNTDEMMKDHLQKDGSQAGTKQPNELQSQSNAPVVESPNTSGVTVGSQVNVGPIKPVSSTPADKTAFPAQPAPRDTTGTKGA